MLPYPTAVLPGKDEFKIFQHYMYFSSDRAAAGLLSDSLIALVKPAIVPTLAPILLSERVIGIIR